VGTATSRVKLQGEETISTAAERASRSIRQMKAEIEKGTGPIREMGKLANSLFALGGATAAIALFRRVNAVVGECIAEYQKHEQAVAQLTAAFSSGNRDISLTVDGLVGLAEQLQRTTLFSHDASESAMGLMRTVGGLGENQIRNLLPRLQDFSTAIGVDLVQTAKMASQSIEGTRNTMGRYGIELEKGASVSEKVAAVIEQLREKFGGLSRAVADTATGAFTRLKNAMSDLKEEAGRALANFFRPLVDWYRKMIEGATDALKAQNDLIEALARQGKGIETTKDYIVIYTGKIKELQEQLAILSGQQAAGVGQWMTLMQNVNPATAVQDIQAQIQAYGRAISALRQKAAADKDAADQATLARQAELNLLDRLEDAYAKTPEGQLEALRTMIAYWETASVKLKGHAAEIRAVLLPLYEQLRKAMEGPTLPLGYRRGGLEVAGAGIFNMPQLGMESTKESLEAMGGMARGQELSQMQEGLEAVSMASVGVSEQFANMVNSTQQSLSQMRDTTITMTDQIAGAFQNMLMSASDWASLLADTLVNVVGTGLVAVGEMIVTGADAWSIFRNAALEACAAVLRAIGEQLLAWAVLKVMMWDWASAALAAAGAVAAFIAAGVLHAYAQSLNPTTTANPVTIPAVAGGGAGGTGGTGYTGSQTTVQQAPDIYIYITVQGSVYGPGGLQQVGGELAEALKEFAGIGGRIHIQEAIVPVRG